MSDLTFEYHHPKAASNLLKHKISFEEAISIFYDPLASTVPDDQHSYNEQRWVRLGTSSRSRLLFVVYTERNSSVRLVSARVANATERRQYEEDYEG